jgi:hypothetical protein
MQCKKNVVVSERTELILTSWGCMQTRRYTVVQYACNLLSHIEGRKTISCSHCGECENGSLLEYCYLMTIEAVSTSEESVRLFRKADTFRD